MLLELANTSRSVRSPPQQALPSSGTVLRPTHTMSPPQIDSEVAVLRVSLAAWYEEKKGTPEYSERKRAAQEIEGCYTSRKTTLHLINFRQLTSLPKAIHKLTFLTTLNLDGCTSLTEVNVRDLSSLTTLWIDGCTSLTKINVKDLPPSLTTLNLYGCTSLTEVNVRD